MTFRCGGTLGDTFMNILRLYNKDVDTIIHFTKHKEYMGAITRLYSLLGDVKIEEGVGERNLNFEGYLGDSDTYTPFPKFNLPNIDKFNLPDEYIVVQLQAGVDIKKHPWRFLDESDIARIPTDLPVVLVGTDVRNVDLSNFSGVIDVRNTTTLFESFNIIANSKGFYAPQGLLGFLALSQKVKSTLWLKHQMEINGMDTRIGKIKEWDNYITYINLIK